MSARARAFPSRPVPTVPENKDQDQPALKTAPAPVRCGKAVEKDRRPITFRVVCALARNVILLRPQFTDSDWKEAVKLIAAKQGWEPPDAELLGRAFSAVEHALAQTVGFHRQAAVPAKAQPSEPERTWSERDYRDLAETLKSIALRTTAVHHAPVVSDTWAMDEPAALDQFYAEAHAGDRLSTLRRFAEIALVRPDDWDYEAERAGAKEHRLFASACFACRLDAPPYHWHHVIQIQHGGSNYLRNRVALCATCHGRVHPWLPQTRPRGGWFRIGDLEQTVRAFIGRQRIEREDAS